VFQQAAGKSIPSRRERESSTAKQAGGSRIPGRARMLGQGWIPPAEPAKVPLCAAAPEIAALVLPAGFPASEVFFSLHLQLFDFYQI
jgi:hypothetical protein